MGVKIFMFLGLIMISLISISNGLTIEMIPIFSHRLQVTPSNSTPRERHQFLRTISYSRVYNIQKHISKSKLEPNSLRSPGSMVKAGYYVTQLNFGYGPGAIAGNLLIDTGVDDTWVQCQGCDPCFNVTKNYNYQVSPTFAPIGIQHTLCDPQLVYEGNCGIDVNYGTAHVSGIMGTDYFNFTNSRTNRPVVIKGLVFGCGLKNVGFDSWSNIKPINTIVGVLGLGPGPRSFVSQLDAQIKGRFSYCLPPWTYTENVPSSVMYFGDDALISGDEDKPVQVISLAPNAKRYHLPLRAISVEGSRLPIDAPVFQLDGINYKTGFFIDSGTPYTMLARSAYNPLRNAIVKFFAQRYDWHPVPNGEFDLCYNSYPSDEQRFPSVALHFLSAKEDENEIAMVLDNTNMFLKNGTTDAFCMMVLPVNDPGPSIFGAFQQANFHILYDVYEWLLYFVPKNCLV